MKRSGRLKAPSNQTKSSSTMNSENKGWQSDSMSSAASTARYLNSARSLFSTQKKVKKRNTKKRKNSSSTIILPPQERPNFIRKGSEIVFKDSFNDRWQSFLEAKKLDEARRRVFRYVYFRRWKLRYFESDMERIKQRTLLPVIEQSTSKSDGKYSKLERECMETLELIRLARSKIYGISATEPVRRQQSTEPESTETTVSVTDESSERDINSQQELEGEHDM